MIRISDIYKLEKAKPYIEDVINDNWLSFSGKYVKKCETYLEKLLKVKHVLLTNSGTSATHCIIKAIKYKQKKNIIAITFIYRKSDCFNFSTFTNAINH